MVATKAPELKLSYQSLGSSEEVSYLLVTSP